MKTEESKVKAYVEAVGETLAKFHFSDLAGADTFAKGMFTAAVLLGEGESEGIYEKACRYYEEFKNARIEIVQEKQIENQVNFEKKLKLKRQMQGL